MTVEEWVDSYRAGRSCLDEEELLDAVEKEMRIAVIEELKSLCRQSTRMMNPLSLLHRRILELEALNA